MIDEALFLKELKRQPLSLVPEYSLQRVAAFIEGVNSASWPNRPLESMIVSREFDRWATSEGDELLGRFSPQHVVEMMFGYGAEAVDAYIALRELLRLENPYGPPDEPTTDVEDVESSAHGFSIQVIQTGPSLAQSISSLRTFFRAFLGAQFDGYQLASYLSGHCWANSGGSSTSRDFLEFLRATYTFDDSEWDWARMMWCDVGWSDEKLLERLQADFKSFCSGAPPVPVELTQTFQTFGLQAKLKIWRKTST